MDESSRVRRMLRTADRVPNQPPPLGRRLLDAWLVAIAGSLAWLLAFLVLLILGADRVWVYTGLAGVVVGVLGMGLMYWQQSASRRGSRSAQRGL